MSILSLLSQSLKEMFWPRRFLPFFLLYFSILIVAFPVAASILSSFFYITTTTGAPPFLITGMALLIIQIIILALVNIWFTAALVYDIKTKRGFSKGLHETKKFYLQLLVFFVILGVILGMVSFVNRVSFILNFAVSWVLAFTVPALIIEGKSFDKAMSRSFEIVRQKMLETFAFWAVLNIARIVIIILSGLIGAVILAPLMIGVISVQDLQNLQYATDYTYAMVGILLSILSNYPIAVSAIALASFFLSVIYVFRYLFVTYYFLEISRKVRQRKTKKRAKRKRRR